MRYQTKINDVGVRTI